MEIHEFTYEPDSEPARLDQVVARLTGGITRAAAQRLIETGMVTVEGSIKKPSVKLRGGERVVVTIPPPVPATPVPEEIPLTVLFEDRDLVVINKPAGMVVHPGAGTSSGTLVNALLAHCHDLSGVGGELRPGIVHRIDKDTSGVIVVAKHDASHQSLAHQFKEHTIKRIYLALIFGSPKTDKGRIESVIGRHPTDRKRMSGKARHGKHAVTHWQVLERYAGVCLLKLRLETGRTHQIRVHLSEAGHPLLGDETYGGTGRLSGIHDPELRTLIREMGRQALHAKTLGFIHPTSGEYMEFDTDLPTDMARIIEYLEHQGQDPKNRSEGAGE
ncbi:MAG: RluA family pseudouridine synthase [Geobacter sp.]|nr:MAG: RluA family pseudouridine synthase [Geobacter sp.]